MKLKLQNRKIQSSGLVEVLTVLVIMSFILISVTNLTMRSMFQVKKNEVEDRAVGIAIRAVEVAKSPNDLEGLDALSQNQEKNYAVLFQDEGISGFVEVSGSIDLSISNCDSSSRYYVNLSNSSDVICNQVKIRNVTNLPGTNLYEIHSIVVYKAADNFLQKDILGYRRETTN